MDLRQYLIAPYEVVPRQLLRQQRSASHQMINFQLEQRRSQQQSQQQSQQAMFTRKPQPQELPTPTRNQVLKGLALYPDILFSILGMRETTFLQQSLQSPVSGFPPAGFDAQDSRKGYYSYTALESKVGRAAGDTKTVDKVNRASKASIPTSPKAGRYAKGQRLQRGQYGSCATTMPLKRKTSTQGTETTDLGRLNKRARQEETSHEGQRGARDSMGSLGWGFDGQVEEDDKTCVDGAIHLTTAKPTKPTTANTNTSTPHKPAHQPSKKVQRKALAALLHTAKPLDTIPYTTSISTHGPGIPSSAHRKKHQTCFAWYHGVCPLRGKNCRFLHALTQPISFVQPPEGFVHGAQRQKSGGGDGKNAKDGKEEEQEVKCTLDWCPGDWLWDHSHSDEDKQHNEEISDKEGDEESDLEE